MPRRMRDPSNTPSPSLSRERSLPRKESTGRSCAPSHPPTMVWGACDRPFSYRRPRKRVDLTRPNRPAASAPPSCPWPSGWDEESVFRNLKRQGQTVQTFLPTFNMLKETISISLFPCGSPPTTCSFAASSPRDRRHSRFSSTVYGPHTGHFSVQCFTLYSPEQGHQGLSFLVEVVASPRPSRRPNTGMSSTSQYSASSIAFFSWMGASTRCIALGSTHSSVRLHTSVWLKPPSLWRGSPESSKQHLEVFCAAAGTFLPPTKGSNRGTTSVRPGARLFQQLLSWTKEGRWSMIHSVPALSEPLPLQDVDVEDYYVPDSSGRLVRHCRPEGCLFSHSGCPAAQEIPSVCFWREGLPVQGSSLWPGLGAEDVHKMHGCCSGPFEAPGHSCTQPPGWLAHSGLLQGVSELSQRYRPLPNSCSRPQTRVFSPLLDKLCFWGFICISFKCKPSGSCPDFQFQCMLGLLQARPSCLCEHLLQAPRPHGPSLTCAASKVAPYEAVPLVDETVEDPLQRTSHSSNQGVSQLLTHPLNMARSHFSPEWSQNRCDSPSPHG